MFSTSEELDAMRATVRRATREQIAPRAAAIDATGEASPEVEALCWDLGLLTLTWPAEHGGLERDPGTALCAAVEEIACHCASSALLLIIQAVGSFPILHSQIHTGTHQITRMVTGRALLRGQRDPAAPPATGSCVCANGPPAASDR